MHILRNIIARQSNLHRTKGVLLRSTQLLRIFAVQHCNMNFFNPFSTPFHVTAKPAGARCNLRCTYCYYLEKSGLYSAQPSHVMSDEMTEMFIRDYIRAQPSQEVHFTWHGGEALLRDTDYYRRVVKWQQKYADGHTVTNSLQTNGTLLNDEWCRFFRKNGWLIGISIDGPQHLHDKYRMTVLGKPSFREVMRGVELLDRHGVEWNALAAINSFNAEEPEEFYDFFKSIGCKYIQFTPVVERMLDGGALASADDAGTAVTDFSVRPAQWGRFACGVFDRWVRDDVGRVFVQLFDAVLANWVGVTPAVCTMAPTCGHAVALEFNGDVYCCDHFVFPQYLLGNLRSKTFDDMIMSSRQRNFGMDKKRMLADRCRTCEYLFACNGECPRNRFVQSGSGPKLNYLCEGYRIFFEHVAPYMDFMKEEYMNGRPPSNVMKAAREGAIKRD